MVGEERFAPAGTVIPSLHLIALRRFLRQSRDRLHLAERFDPEALLDGPGKHGKVEGGLRAGRRAEKAAVTHVRFVARRAIHRDDGFRIAGFAREQKAHRMPTVSQSLSSTSLSLKRSAVALGTPSAWHSARAGIDARASW